MTRLPTLSVGARRLPVGPSMAAIASLLTDLLTSNSLTFLPLDTCSVEAALSMARASVACSFRLAGTDSFISTSLASKNLEALVQVVQPLR